MTIREDVLDTAKQYVSSDRQADHGAPENTFGLIAKLWSAYLTGDGQDGEIIVTPADSAVMLGLLKVARQRMNPDHGDNYVDLAGYAACAAELQEAKP